MLPSLRHAINANDARNDVTIDYWLTWLANNRNWMPTSLAIYGGENDPRYAMVLHPNPNRVRWTIEALNQNAAGLTTRYAPQVSMNKVRPACVDISSDRGYATLLRDDVLAGGVEMRHDMSDAALGAANQALFPLGYYPTQLAVSGSGVSRRYAVVYAQSENIKPRIVTNRGDTCALPITVAFTQILQQQGIRQGSLAITKGSKLVYARGLTRAEEGYRIVTPTMRVRVASVSKTLCAMLIMRAHQEGLGRVGATPLYRRKMQDILRLTTPTVGAPPAAFWPITVEQALTAQTTIPRDVTNWEMRSYWQSQGWAVPSSFSSEQFASYALTKPFMATPGYSNTAFLMLGLEQRSVRNGRDFDHLAEGDRQSGRIMIGWPARAAAVAVRHRGELHVDTSMVAQCDGQWT